MYVTVCRVFLLQGFHDLPIAQRPPGRRSSHGVCYLGAGVKS
jgi:hypothetical protein